MYGTAHKPKNPLKEAFARVRGGFAGIWLFSFAINILMLTGPMFMLQVYDRVLSSRSVPTLVVLFGFVVGLYAFYGLFEFLRNRMLSRIGYDIDVRLMPQAQKAWIRQGNASNAPAGAPVSDLASLRRFMCGGGPAALFDLPWLPIFLVFVFALHVWLGLLAVGGVTVVVFLALLNELTTRKPISQAAGLEHVEGRFGEKALQNADAIVSMGMMKHVTDHWSAMRHEAMANAQRGGGRTERFAALSKAIRMIIQSAILGLGAYLAILQEISPGAMIAASILAARAIAPVDQAIGNWRNFVNARTTYARLKTALAGHALGELSKTQLPQPKGRLSISSVFKFRGPDAHADPIIKAMSFDLNPGDGLGVIGPSASGKSSLARLLVGLWSPDKGEIRLDGATFDQWDRDQLGRHIGYLPQNVSLLPGTVSQNIARFDPQAEDDEVIRAARLAGVHDLILQLPGGYDTIIGEGPVVLSGGQAQRIALARAVFREPTLVVLDEPNANLDHEGDKALASAVAQLRAHGKTVIVMAHRPSALASVNLVMMIRDGTLIEFGPKKKTLKKITRPANTLRAAVA